MGKCASDCEYVKLLDDRLKDYVTAESGGYCTKLDTTVWFGDECSDYKPKDEQDK